MDQRMSEHFARADEYQRVFRGAQPFPHISIDDFLPEPIAQQLVETFPGPESPIWTQQPTEDQLGKLATTDEGAIPALQRYVLLR